MPGDTEKTVEESSAAQPSRRPSPPSGIASWYTDGVSDGLGDRLLMFDNTEAESLELLRFRPELAAADGFERALRASVRRLAAFRHPAFSPARAVERLEDDRLALVSTHAAGKRLSEIFERPVPQRGMHPGFALWLVGQLAPALAALHAQGVDVAHGVLTSDRIVLAEGGKFVIVEYVLGAAMDRLRLSADRLWHDLGIVTAPSVAGPPRLDAPGDIAQLALIALSIVIGRRVTTAEYPDQLNLLLDEFTETAARRAPTIAPDLRQWLERALGGRGGRFGSALEAADALRAAEIRSGAPPFDLSQPAEFPSTKPRGLPMPQDRIEPVPVPPPLPAALAAPPVPEPLHDAPGVPDRGVDLESFAFLDVLDAEIAPTPDATRDAYTAQRLDGSAAHNVDIWIDDPPTPESWLANDAGVEEDSASSDVAFVGPPRQLTTLRFAAAGWLALAIVEAAVLVWLVSAPVAPIRTSVPVTIESAAAAGPVLVDGRQIGVSPLQLTIDESVHVIRLPSPPRPALADTPRTTSPLDMPPVHDTTPADAAIGIAAVRQRSGGVRVSSPIDLQVLLDERLLGSSADGPVFARAGRRELDLVNDRLGFRAKLTVAIEAGRIVTLAVKPPDGQVSVNALPWAQVWIDGTPVGETPLANLRVPLGDHTITFRHPQLGERTHTTTVRADAPTRVSVSFSQ